LPAWFESVKEIGSKDGAFIGRPILPTVEGDEGASRVGSGDDREPVLTLKFLYLIDGFPNSNFPGAFSPHAGTRVEYDDQRVWRRNGGSDRNIRI
jgi:hypothetical protein